MQALNQIELTAQEVTSCRSRLPKLITSLSKSIDDLENEIMSRGGPSGITANLVAHRNGLLEERDALLTLMEKLGRL